MECKNGAIFRLFPGTSCAMQEYNIFVVITLFHVDLISQLPSASHICAPAYLHVLYVMRRQKSEAGG